tara:strand:- start:742 stop:1236 length:495 start_codon:yes stop_codon:yes gene_type:complete
METQELDIIEKKELIINREKKIQTLLNTIFEAADGVRIVGDGKHIIHETDCLKITHEFSEGVYIRRMDFDKDTFVAGAIHKDLHVWFLMIGNITVATNEEGSREFIAPCYVIANPGVQRLIYAKENSIFMNIYPNPSNKEDIDEIEKRIYCLNREEYNEYIKNK